VGVSFVGLEITRCSFSKICAFDTQGPYAIAVLSGKSYNFRTDVILNTFEPGKDYLGLVAMEIKISC